MVLEPLVTPRRYRDALTERVLEAFARRDATELTRLLTLSERAKEDLGGEVRQRPSAHQLVLSGLRTYSLRDVILETTDGEMRVRLEPTAAPRTAYRFLRLVADGFYEGIAFHRVINADAEGLPFIVQCGDPTGTGFGGVGDLADFEPSTLPHDRGVLSMARRTDDPNSNGSQFFICLGRDACAKLDGLYTSFARVESGFDTLETIASTPVAPPDDDEGESVPQRPIRPPVLLHARPVPAPSLAIHAPPAPKPDVATPVVR
jgi:cyclophilin family peptidyl-prolyl cis-trans isomerase